MNPKQIRDLIRKSFKARDILLRLCQCIGKNLVLLGQERVELEHLRGSIPLTLELGEIIYGLLAFQRRFSHMK